MNRCTAVVQQAREHAYRAICASCGYQSVITYYVAAEDLARIHNDQEGT